MEIGGRWGGGRGGGTPGIYRYVFIVGLPFEEPLVGHGPLEFGFEVVDMALEFFRAGPGVANWARCLSFDYEAFGDVVGSVGVIRGRTIPFHRI